MEGLLSVSVGTVFWASIAFIAVLVILKKMAWGPILQTLEEREQGIANALKQAELAKEEMASLKSGNEQLLKEAREERDRILKEAKEAKEAIINEARERAKEEAQKITQAAKLEIEHQKMEMLTNVRNEIGLMSIEIAEKLIHQRLSDKQESLQLTKKLVDEIRFGN